MAPTDLALEVCWELEALGSCCGPPLWRVPEPGCPRVSLGASFVRAGGSPASSGLSVDHAVRTLSA